MYSLKYLAVGSSCPCVDYLLGAAACSAAFAQSQVPGGHSRL